MTDEYVYYEGESGAVHVLENSFSVVPVGPVVEDPTYQGQAPAITTNDGSPPQWQDSTVTGPGFDWPVYVGRSDAIHVFGDDDPEWPPQPPVVACECESGVARVVGWNAVGLTGYLDAWSICQLIDLEPELPIDLTWEWSASNYFNSHLKDSGRIGEGIGGSGSISGWWYGDYSQLLVIEASGGGLGLSRGIALAMDSGGALWSPRLPSSGLPDYAFSVSTGLQVPFSFSPDQHYYFRMQIGSGQQSYKMWPRGSAEPGWQSQINASIYLTDVWQLRIMFGRQWKAGVTTSMPAVDFYVHSLTQGPDATPLDLFNDRTTTPPSWGAPSHAYPGPGGGGGWQTQFSPPPGYAHTPTRQQEVLVADCPECEDPYNPGVSIPPFTPGYMPTFRRQIGDPTTWLDSYICTLESAAMVLDWHTRGAIKVWGGELIPWCGKTEQEILNTPGTTLGDAWQAWLHWSQHLEIRSGTSWNALMNCLAEGRAVILQGDYGEFTLAERCQDSFVDNHAISVYPYQSGDRLLVGDPICYDFKGFKISSLQAYAEALGVAVYGVTSPQKILYAVSRPWTP